MLIRIPYDKINKFYEDSQSYIPSNDMEKNMAI
jgi:hypothetical protein